MIVLDDNLKPTGEYEKFESQNKAEVAINQRSGIISEILNTKYSQKTTTDRRTGNTVTFIRANATKEEILEWFREIENKKSQPIKVIMIVLDENLQPTGESREFESETKAEITIGRSKGTTSLILNSSYHNKTATDERTGNTVTFVRADATEKEVLEWLKEVENKEKQPRKIKVVYAKSGKVKYFDSMGKASTATGIDKQVIKNDIDKKFKKPHKRYHKETGEEIKFYEA